jgi:hypothetical protein
MSTLVLNTNGRPALKDYPAEYNEEFLQWGRGSFRVFRALKDLDGYRIGEINGIAVVTIAVSPELTLDEAERHGHSLIRQLTAAQYDDFNITEKVRGEIDREYLSLTMLQAFRCNC